MGYETKCRVRVDDRAGSVREAHATVLLETDELIVRGEARVRVPRTSIERVTARAGVVTITSPTAVVSLSLDEKSAAAWRKRLEEPPKKLIDKLDVKPDMKVWLFRVSNDALCAQVAERTHNVVRGTAASNCDVVFVGVDTSAQLDRIDRALAAIGDRGAIWVVHPKGADGVADTVIFAKATALGLTYTKVARISDTLTAEKLVRPLASRTASPTRSRRG
jgi:putative ribosome biogenesis GTPase RsgA